MKAENVEKSEKSEKAEKVEKMSQLKQKRIEYELEKKQREERKRQLEMERKEKKEKAEREKEAKRIKLEAEKQAKLDQKLREQKEKEEQRQKREEEKRKKDEEKRKKEEERQKRECERQKKLDEKRLLEEMKHKKELEEKEKKEKEQNRFRRFFKQDSKSPVTNDSQLNNSFGKTNTIFKPFQLQPNQSLAPLVPAYIKQRFDSNKLDELILLQNTDRNDLYLSKLKNVHRGHKLKMKNIVDDDVLLEDETPQMKYKAKLFQFHENNRPAYFGTWRKKSNNVSARNPFAKDEVFNYDVDSDDEWEEEEEEKGESLKDNDSEISEEEGDGYELDDMFVSHGYLSDDEQREDDGTDGAAEVNRGGILVKEEVLFDEKKKPVKKLQPLVIGCIWRDTVSDKNSLKILQQYSATYLTL